MNPSFERFRQARPKLFRPQQPHPAAIGALRVFNAHFAKASKLLNSGMPKSSPQLETIAWRSFDAHNHV